MEESRGIKKVAQSLKRVQPVTPFCKMIGTPTCPLGACGQINPTSCLKMLTWQPCQYCDCSQKNVIERIINSVGYNVMTT